jgi:hypothetical protein
MGSLLQQIAPTIVSLMVIAALALLWRASRSIWLVVAIVAELVALVFRGAYAFMPDLARTIPMMYTIWSLSAFVFAVGLLGYAIEQGQKAKP